MKNAQAKTPRARIAMCAPEFFEVSYSINPWMHPTEWESRRSELTKRSLDGWTLLKEKFEALGVVVDLVPPQPGMPDLVFTANAAVILDGRALVARFRHPERNVEEPHFRRFFDQQKENGLLTEVVDMPEGICLEGAGDCVHDGKRGIFYLGYGFRSDKAAAPVVARMFEEEVVALELVDPRFYHMDTCLCPLTGGEAMWVPEAFSAEGRAILTERFGADGLIEVPAEDAAKLACNAVNLGTDIVLAEASPLLKSRLNARGYTVHEVPIRSFGLSGGSAWCLVLRLDRASARQAASLERAA